MAIRGGQRIRPLGVEALGRHYWRGQLEQSSNNAGRPQTRLTFLLSWRLSEQGRAARRHKGSRREKRREERGERLPVWKKDDVAMDERACPGRAPSERVDLNRRSVMGPRVDVWPPGSWYQPVPFYGRGAPLDAAEWGPCDASCGDKD